MREFFRRLRSAKTRESPEPSTGCQDEEANTELRQAQVELRHSKRERDRAEDVAGRLRKLNEENHFSRDMLAALRGIITNE